MGQGQGRLENDKIIVQNEQTGEQDEITINSSNEATQIDEYISSLNQHGVYYMERGVFKKTNENIVSFAGDLWEPDLWSGTAWYTWSQWRMQVTNYNSALHFRYHKTDGITKQEGLYCIQRYYKKRVKFLYSRFTKDNNDDVVIFSFDPNEDGKPIKNNKGLRYL